MIRFYSPKDLYGAFSNFSRHPVSIYDRIWSTSEHAFQGMKFWPHRPDLVDKVHIAATPTDSTLIGRNRANPVRQDWDLPPTGGMRRPPVTIDDGVYRDIAAEPVFSRTKDVFMYEIVLAKFSQHEELKALLLGTGDQPLVEDAVHDPYWGWGCSHNGHNKLGRILMLVRSELYLRGEL